MTAIQREHYNEYMRVYMNIRREKQRAAKICPDCGTRHVEYRCIYCPECAEIRRQISNDISAHTQMMKKRAGATA